MTTTCAGNRLLTPFLLRLIKFQPSNTVPTQKSDTPKSEFFSGRGGFGKKKIYQFL